MFDITVNSAFLLIEFSNLHFLGLAEKIMSATIEYSYVCVECNNIPQAIRILEEALVLLDVSIQCCFHESIFVYL